MCSFTFVDAPFELPIEEGQSVAMRSWSNPGVVSQKWNRAVNDLIDGLWGELKFDGIVAFSQGTCVAYVLAKLAKAGHPKLKSLSFLIVAGALLPMEETKREERGTLVSIPSLHFIGNADRVVSPSQSLAFASHFEDAQVCRHEKGHLLPQRRAEVDIVLRFLEARRSGRGNLLGSAPLLVGFEVSEEQADEMEALESIFEDSFRVDHAGTSERPPNMRLRLWESVAVLTNDIVEDDDDDVVVAVVSEEVKKLLSSVQLRAIFTKDYPEKEIPHLTFVHAKTFFLRMAALRAPPDMLDKSSIASDLTACVLRELRHEATSMIGDGAMMFELVTWVKSRLLRLARTSLHSDSQSRLVSSERDIAAKTIDDSDDAAATAADDGTTSFEAPVIRTMDEDEENRIIREADLEAAKAASKPYASTQRGSWANYTIGLVGKPSAGKSTFYNGVITRADTGRVPSTERSAASMTTETTTPVSTVAQDDPKGLAKIGAFPFTTIDPNESWGFFSKKDPSSTRLRGVRAESLAAKYGRAASGNRLLRIRIKDVAGLVPGAYQGRGRGNAFLNDLCDADVLIHIVDASATTDARGNSSLSAATATTYTKDDAPEEVGDPVDDVVWIRRELHRWIFANVSAKWPQICRRPGRLWKMFSGYHATEDLVTEALKRCGLSPKSLDVELPRWKQPARMLHRIVAHFLRIRFPILLALNKADLPSASRHVERIREKHALEPSVVMSASAEWWLKKYRSQGFLRYVAGNDAFQLNRERIERSLSASDTRAFFAKASRIEAFLVKQCAAGSGTGVLEAIDAAVALRPPVVCYPVETASSCKTLVSTNSTEIFVPTNTTTTVAAGMSNGFGRCTSVAKKRSAEGDAE
eukprot:g1789.t1